MVLLAVALTLSVLVIAAENALAGRPAWRAWMASCTLIGALAAVVAVPVVVGHALR